MSKQGINSKIEHKVALYVNDVVIFMVNKLHSVGHLCKLLNVFSNVFGCKVSEEKSVFLGLKVVSGYKQQISQRCKAR